MISVVLLTGGDVSQLVLDHGEHLPDCEEDPSCELVLVVDLQPSVDDLSNLRLEHLGDLQLEKGSVLENLEVLGHLGRGAELP